MPDPATQHYQGESGRQYHEVKRAIPPATFDWVARLRARKLAPHIQPDDTVLEFGVGHGWNLAALPCRRRLGFDISELVGPGLAAAGERGEARLDDEIRGEEPGQPGRQAWVTGQPLDDELPVFAFLGLQHQQVEVVVLLRD